MALGPRNRNYDVSLTSEFALQTRPVGEGPWSDLQRVQSLHRQGTLVVNNPWRSTRPDDLNSSLTPRSLLHSNGVAPFGESIHRGGYEYKRTGPFAGAMSFGYNVFPFSEDYTSQLKNEAVIDALKRLKDQKFNAGVAMAEASGVARMLTDAGRLVTGLRNDLRKGDPKKAYERFRRARPDIASYPSWRREHWETVRQAESVRRASKVPEGWLYYHYGIKPTINDIDGAAQEVILNSRTNPNYFRGKVVGYAKVRRDGVVHQYSDGNHHDHTWTWRDSMRAVLHVVPRNEYTARAAQLGVTNPGEAIWNRIPFSFLVDYFVSVGDWLHTLDAWIGYDFSTWETIHRQHGQNKITLSGEQEPSLVRQVITPGRTSYKKIVRELHEPLYGPMADTIPMLKLRNPSMTQVASMLSLLATSFKRTVRP